MERWERVNGNRMGRGKGGRISRGKGSRIERGKEENGEETERNWRRVRRWRGKGNRMSGGRNRVEIWKQTGDRLIENTIERK